MATTVTETENSRVGSAEGLNRTSYVRRYRVLLDVDDTTHFPSNWRQLSVSERERYFPSITGIVRHNVIPWGDPHPWNSNALAIGWDVADEINPLHYIVAVTYQVETTPQTGDTGVPTGWTISRISGSTYNKELLQELALNEKGRSVRPGASVLDSPLIPDGYDPSRPRIIGPPKFELAEGADIVGPLIAATHQYKKTDTETVQLIRTHKREPQGLTVDVPMAVIELTRRVSSFNTSVLGQWIGKLGLVNASKFLGAEPGHVKFKAIDAIPQVGDINIGADTGRTIIHLITIVVEWRAERFTPQELTWWHTLPDGSKAFVTPLESNEPVKEGFVVADSFNMNNLFRIV